MTNEIKVGQHGKGCECPNCHNRPYTHWKEADQTKCETLHKKKGDRIVVHEKEKAQYEEDCKNYEQPWELWQFKNPNLPAGCGWITLNHSPTWNGGIKYRRKEPSFTHEYFSGLNWREALEKGLVEREVEFSQSPDHGWEKGTLSRLHTWKNGKFKRAQGYYFEYIRTTPQTYKHPIITIGGVELPRPEIEAPEKGTSVWITTGSFIKTYAWNGDWVYAQQDLESGRLHLTEPRAQKWADWWENTIIAAIKGD